LQRVHDKARVKVVVCDPSHKRLAHHEYSALAVSALVGASLGRSSVSVEKARSGPL
jgi:hypothetical protein